MTYYIDTKRGLAIAQIPRAGLTTFMEWLGSSFKRVKNDNPQLMTLSTRVAFFRNPQERLKSAFSLMYWIKEYSGKYHRSYSGVLEWEPFVDYILDPDIPDDGHWMAQAEICGDIPNIYHKFEHLTDHWEKYRPGVLPHSNRTSRRPTTDYRSLEIAEKYSKDFSIWQVAN